MSGMRSATRSPKHFQYGLQQNLGIQKRAPIIYILEIQLHVLLERRISACRYLPEAGNSRKSFQTAQVFQLILIIVVNRVRPGADHAHVALEHIKDLGKFVNTELAKDNTYARNAGIIGNLECGAIAFIQVAQIVFARVRIHHHRAEFIAQKLASLSSDTPCFIDCRTGRIEVDRERGQQQDWRAHYSERTCDHKIDGALYKKSQSWDRPVIEFQDGNIADASEFRTQGQTAIQIRNDSHADPLLAGL